MVIRAEEKERGKERKGKERKGKRIGKRKGEERKERERGMALFDLIQSLEHCLFCMVPGALCMVHAEIRFLHLDDLLRELGLGSRKLEGWKEETEARFTEQFTYLLTFLPISLIDQCLLLA